MNIQSASKQKAQQRQFEMVALLLGGMGIILSLLLTPPVFAVCFAMGGLLHQDITNLWFFSGIVFFCSLFCLLLRKSIKSEILAIYFSLLVLMGGELGARLFVIIFKPGMKEYLAHLSNITYPEFMAYKGHPFLQFTGNPSMSVLGDQGVGKLPPFNNVGFSDKDFTYTTPPNVIRIAALGGSTTQRGYPQVLENFLNDHTQPDAYQFEVLNFGLGWYTSAHSLVNFVLNVVDFSPDYVIIHHAWNDEIVRETRSAEFRGDYSHILKNFAIPHIPDKYPIRISIVYRYVKAKLTTTLHWAFLGNVIINQDKRRVQQPTWSNMDELKPFKRNLTTIIDLALLRGMQVVLTTQPHSTDPDVLYSSIGTHIDQCNAIIRELHQEYQEKILFVDLDATMTGKMNDVFIDIAHVNHTGRDFKAEHIGQAILTSSTKDEGKIY